jgi:hypothetical protein
MNSRPDNSHRWLTRIILTIFVLINHQVIANETEDETVISPVRLNKDMVSGIGLKVKPWFDDTVTARTGTFYVGSGLSVTVFESTPKDGNEGKGKKLKNLVKNYPRDQFVLVLSGKSILTDQAGNSQTFSEGDLFVVPKGFTGTWEEFGIYRELVVVSAEDARTGEFDIELVE